MQIKKYQITVTTDTIHGWKKSIVEFWIPPIKGKHKGIVFNFHGDDDNKLLCWFDHKPRHSIKECHGKCLEDVELDDEIADVIFDYLKIRQRLNSFGKLKKLGKSAEQIEKKESAKQFEIIHKAVLAMPIVSEINENKN